MGKTVVITGASSGIGAATARALAREGANLVLGARRRERLEAVAAECRQLCVGRGQTLALPCDVTRRGDVEQLAAAAVEQFGRLDVMIANAGYGLLANVHETTEEQFDDLVRTNVKGTWYAMQAAANIMLQQTPAGTGKTRRGHIVVVSSGAARRGLPLYGVYAMTKAAQLSLCEAMRVELARHGVYVSSVHPLTTATEFFDVASSKSRLRSTGLGHAQSVEVVARKIARLIHRPRPELWPVAGSAWLLAVAAALPRMADWAMARTVGNRTR